MKVFVIYLISDKDYFIGLPHSELHRLARVVPATRREFIKAVILNPFYTQFCLRNLLENFGTINCHGLMDIAGTYPSWLGIMQVC